MATYQPPQPGVPVQPYPQYVQQQSQQPGVPVQPYPQYIQQHPQQPGVTIQPYPQTVQHQPQPLAIPPQLKRSVFFISIALICGASASIIFGIIGAAVRFYGVANFSGVNIWAGLFYLGCGILGVVHYKNFINISLQHAFYAFSIMGLIMSVPHLAISIGTLSSYGAAVGVISLAFALIGFSLTLAVVIILSQHIYCGRNGIFNQPHYMGTTVTVSHPGVVMYAGNPAIPQQQQYIYNQQMPAGGMVQPVQTLNQQIPAGGMVQPVPVTNSQPINTTNMKPPVA